MLNKSLDSKSESDWDILVLTKGQYDMKDETKIRKHLYELELEIETPISVSIFSKENWLKTQSITPFFDNVIKDAIYL